MQPNRMNLALALAAWLALAPALAAQAGAGTGAAALRPDSVLTPPGGPKLIQLSAPGSGLTALRLSVPVKESSVEAGAAQILALLGLDRARASAAAIGARVDGGRTPWGIAYTVVGSAEDFDYLAYVLREAVAEPRLDRVEFENARIRARGEAERASETAAGRLSLDLRAAAVPGSLPLSGTMASLDGLTAAMVRDLWARTHRRARMALVVVGPEPLELVLASLDDIGSAERGPTTVPDARLPTSRGGRIEVLRSWYGEAWVAGDAREPRGAVAAALIAARLREAEPAFQTNVELWDVGKVRVLAVTGAAYPTGAAAMRRRVQGVLAETADHAGREEVAPAVAAIRLEQLAAARTPWGLATQVGRYHDATGDPAAAYQQMIALERVDADAVRAYLEDLKRRGPVRAEVRP